MKTQHELLDLCNKVNSADFTVSFAWSGITQTIEIDVYPCGFSVEQSNELIVLVAHTSEDSAIDIVQDLNTEDYYVFCDTEGAYNKIVEMHNNANNVIEVINKLNPNKYLGVECSTRGIINKQLCPKILAGEKLCGLTYIECEHMRLDVSALKNNGE
jgi:hypothetical protein